jgi:hypothetical protein
MNQAIRPDSLARQIVVRHRGEGHVRFGLPVALCEEDHAQTIEAALAACPGVYRVTLYRAQAKLSVFYHPAECQLADVARTLFAALAQPAAQLQRVARTEALVQRLHVGGPLDWIRARLAALRLRIEQIKVKGQFIYAVARHQIDAQPLLRNALSERAIIGFINDLVTFYLVKVHWELITTRWLKQPIKYRSAWMTTFYLLFLLVRHRKQAALTHK